MASILKVGNAWRAQVRRKGHKSIAETFTTKAQAVAWARKIEAEMDARRFNDTRGLANITLNQLIDWYFDEIGTNHPFGKNKTAVLKTWQRNHGQVRLADITPDYLTTFVRNRRNAGAGGVTISIDLTYLCSMFKSARDLRKLPLSLDAITIARANMAHLKISSKSNECVGVSSHNTTRAQRRGARAGGAGVRQLHWGAKPSSNAGNRYQR